MDYAIVGGGIAGLYCARELSKKYPKAKICIYEKYRIFGGRVLTFREGSHQWEAGAGRIHVSHKLTRKLLKEYGLTEVPIPSGSSWIETYGSTPVPNQFDATLQSWLYQVSLLPHTVLATHTLHEVLEKIFPDARALTIQFPYWGEIFTLRADLAVKSFMHEMGEGQSFVVSPEGYDRMIEGLVKDLEKRGVELKRRHTLTDVISKEKGKTKLTFAMEALEIEVIARNVIFALPQVALEKLKFFKNLQILNYVRMEPLVRIYAVFPTGSDGKAWFHDIGKFVTATPIRYFIPVGPTTVMISYTDGDDTLAWSNLEHGTRPIEEETIGMLVTRECQKLFPEKNIPFPTFLKVHPWDAGASYWVPGNYDPAAVQKKSLQPFPNLYICGESFSLRQAWIEGALENTEELLRIL